MIGWNYPAKGNLQDIIEEHRLHPFTCLMTLSNQHKRALLNKGVVLCTDIYKSLSLLKEIGMGEVEEKAVIAEIQEVCGLQV
jgi:hypothetical protein